ncbi:TonB C-terminal domain-containing protein [candidate division WOR-3 bacterium]|nr:TonB C-terminal domain-containing protein [candidate division WOR-3 bacterium]
MLVLSKIQDLIQRSETERVAYRVNLVASREDLQNHIGSEEETPPETTDEDVATTVFEQPEVDDNSDHNILPNATGGEDPVWVNIPGLGPEDPYIKSIVRKVARYYTDPLGSGTGIKKATIVFTINRSGDISGAQIQESSGSSSLDLAALRAVKNSSPFPPLPDKFGDSVVVHFYFEHR